MSELFAGSVKTCRTKPASGEMLQMLRFLPELHHLLYKSNIQLIIYVFTIFVDGSCVPDRDEQDETKKIGQLCNKQNPPFSRILLYKLIQ